MDSGISGVHVVQENLRQMCIWDQANETVADHQKWWKYQVLFSTHCSEYNENATNNEYFSVTNFNKDCSERQQIAAGLDPETTEACVTASGGAEVEGGVNTRFDATIQLKNRKRVWLMPYLLINNEPYRGGLYCPEPVSMATCSVLNSICAGFPDKDRPAACSKDYCWTTVDKCGVCGGDGNCKVDSSTFTLVLVLSIVALVVLVPLSVFGLRKWCAYRDLLRQYDQLRQTAGANDFPGGADYPVEMDMHGGIDIIPGETYDTPHTGIIPSAQQAEPASGPVYPTGSEELPSYPGRGPDKQE